MLTPAAGEFQFREVQDSDGKHLLWLRVGGSEGHASFWSLDIDEGLIVDSEGNQRTTKWETKLSRFQDAKAAEKRRREDRKAEETERRDNEHCEQLLRALEQCPEGETEKRLRAVARLNPDNFQRAMHYLEKEGRAEPCTVVKNKVEYPGYRRIKRVLPASVCEDFSAARYRGLSAHELVEDSSWVREKPAPCPPAWRGPSSDSSVGGRPERSPHASPDRCGPWRRGSPACAGFPAPPRHCESTIGYSSSVSTTMLPPGVGLKRVPPNHADHLSMVPGRCPAFSNWPLLCQWALASAFWSWKTTLGRRCAFLSRARRRPTWLR
jgi:hypothetical protein